MFNAISLPEVKEFTETSLPSHAQQNYHIDVILVDLLGNLKGKRIGYQEVEGFIKKGVLAPRQMYVFDNNGNVCTNLDYGTEDGDPDFPLYGHSQSLRKSINDDNNLQIFSFMEAAKGQVIELDSRYQLQKMISKFDKLGINVKIGLELEFYLLAEDTINNQPEAIFRQPNSNSLVDLDQLEPFFSLLKKCIHNQGISVQALMSETGPGQFELAFSVNDNLLRACDDFVICKRILSYCAKKFNYRVCFMAKPFNHRSGSGLHVHLSFYDKKTGRNMIADYLDPKLGTYCSTEALYAINGILESIDDFMAIFAPNANSYKRIKPGSFAPANKAWGANNRTVAIRLPKASTSSARIEHRLSGSDTNPYLTVSAVLIGVLEGFKKKKQPPPFITKNAYDQSKSDSITIYLSDALADFKKSDLVKKYFGKIFHEAYLKNREYENLMYHSEVTAKDFHWYLGNI